MSLRVVLIASLLVCGLGIRILYDAKVEDKKAAPRSTQSPLAGILYIVKDAAEHAEFLKNNQAQLDKAGIPYKPFFGVAASNLSAINFQQYFNGGVDQLWWRPKKTVGIFLSHAMLLKEISKMPWAAAGNYLIMEADMKLKPNWHDVLLELAREVPADYDMYGVGYWGYRYCADRVENKPVFRTNGPAKDIHGYYHGTGAYVVKKQSVNKILEALKAGPVQDLDNRYVSLSRARTINMYSSAVDKMIGAVDPGYVSFYQSQTQCEAEGPKTFAVNAYWDSPAWKYAGYFQGHSTELEEIKTIAKEQQAAGLQFANSK